MLKAAVEHDQRDPFNWPSLQRKDLMSATNGLKADKDLFKMIKENLRPKSRLESANLQNDDI
jgi:hypothetical protein